MTCFKIGDVVNYFYDGRRYTGAVTNVVNDIMQKPSSYIVEVDDNGDQYEWTVYPHEIECPRVICAIAVMQTI